MTKQRALSELECFALGLVWQMGSCTPYQIRQQMLESPSTEWSGSAGAVYPMMRRLKNRGLLNMTSGATGRRKHEVYRITPAGLKVLKEWIGPPMAEHTKSVAHDPLRSRARFLGALTRRQQVAWLRAALEVLDEVSANVRQWRSHHSDEDEFLQLVARTGELDVQSRRKWLKEVLERLEGLADD